MSLGNALDSMKEVPGVIKYFIMVLSGKGVLWFAYLKVDIMKNNYDISVG